MRWSPGNPKLRTKRILIMCVLYAVLWSGHCQTLTPLPRHEYTLEFRDRMCSVSGIAGLVTASSSIQCLAHCSKDPTCKGIVYNSADGGCVMCNQSYTDKNDMLFLNGLQYYKSTLGEWNPWGSWSSCSHTCGGGNKTRTRTCTTSTCVIGDNEETQSCHDFSCFPLESTCAGWLSRGLTESCNADIDPDGIAGSDFDVVNVYCEINLEIGNAITWMHHDKENRTHVINYESCGSYSITLNYDVGFEAAKKIADASSVCSQFINYECLNAEITDCTFWRNRSQTKSPYFTTQHISGRFCQCGHTESCADPAYDCNCDINDFVWRSDSGYITNKHDLPIYGFEAWDTGDLKDEGHEQAYHVIGPLLCW